MPDTNLRVGIDITAKIMEIARFLNILSSFFQGEMLDFRTAIRCLTC